MRAIIIVLLFAWPACAEEPAKPDCRKPALPAPGKPMHEADAPAFVAALDTYSSCMQAFIRERKAAVERYQKAAQEAAAAANLAVKDYNAFIEVAERATQAR